MPRPNIDKPEEQILFQCKCNGDHWLELLYLKWDDPEWNDFYVNIFSEPISLWRTLGWWWKQRRLWATELILEKRDLQALNSFLTKYLNEKRKD